VLQADRSRRRISLSLKQAEDPSSRPAESELSDYPGEIERVPEAERERVYAEVSAAPQE
jgi:ribosomal protein S1